MPSPTSIPLLPPVILSGLLVVVAEKFELLTIIEPIENVVILLIFIGVTHFGQVLDSDGSE